MKQLDFQHGESFHDVLARHRGVGPSFDLLRFGLAFLLLVGHTRWIGNATGLGAAIGTLVPGTAPAAGEAVHWVGATKPVLRAMVPAFFALSGFLVLGSAFRIRSMPVFLAHRALRIFPALAVEVTLSALLLGPLLTTLAPGDYFRHEEFFRYFGNILGFVTLYLPGVFTTNPVERVVNANLWTLPSEFYCYLITAVLLSTRLMYNRALCTTLVGIATVVLLVMDYRAGFNYPAGPFPAHIVVYYFFIGMLFYHYKERVPMRMDLFLVSLSISYVCLMFEPLAYVAPIPLTYCTLFFGLVRLPKVPYLSTGDYSYGIYLYGFPIGQTLMALAPGLKSNVLLLVALTAVATMAFSVASWHLIEKHALSLKRLLPRPQTSTQPSPA